MNNIADLLAILSSSIQIKVASIFVSLIIASIIFRGILKHFIFKFVKYIIAKQSTDFMNQLNEYKSFVYALRLAPLLVVYIGVKYFITTDIKTISLIQNIIIITIIVTIVQLINSIISIVLAELKSVKKLNSALIRTIHQVIKIILFCIVLITSLSILLGKSPALVLSSFGAFTAILLLVFKDSILGFMASIQVSLLGVVKEGDWIEMPAYNADGNILDINISTIRVQNWDKTITTIPTYALVSQPVKN